MLLMVEKGTRGGISRAIHVYVEASNKYMEDNKNKEWSYLVYLDINSLYGYGMLQNLPSGGFKWVGNRS